jgi:hypothetical protein
VLAPDDFDLDADPPAAVLGAEYTKNGKTAVQPLPPDVAEALRGYLTGRSAGSPVWPGGWFEDAAEMLRIDLDAAGIPYAVPGPDGPLYADFHSLRHSFVALLDRAGVSLKQAMQLARHSDPKLTMARYGRAQLHDLGAAVSAMPPLVAGPATEAQPLHATGTEGAERAPCRESLRSACASNESGGGPLRRLRRLRRTGYYRYPREEMSNPLHCEGLRLIAAR